MRKFFVYEGGATITFLGVTLIDINVMLETCLLVVGIASALLAFWQALKNKRK